MKKLALLVTFASTLLAACGNEEIADGKYYVTETHIGDGTSCVISERAIQNDHWVIEVISEGEGDEKMYYFIPNEGISAPIPSTDGSKMVESLVDMIATGPYAKSMKSTLYTYKTTIQIEKNEDVDNTLWLNKLDVRKKSFKANSKAREKDWVKKILSNNEYATRVCLAKKATS